MSFFEKAKADIVAGELVFDGWNTLHVYDLDYTSSKGKTVRLKREILDHGAAAAILLYDPARDMIVLVRQYRIAAQFAGLPPFMLELPAGLLDDDHPEEAIRREALEETGYEVGVPHPICEVIVSPGAVTETVHLFAARIDASHKVSEGGGLDDEHEDIEIVEMKLQDAYDLVASGQIVDAKTVIALQWAMLNRETLANL